MLVPAVDRRHPALRTFAGGLGEHVEALGDGRLLHLRRHLQQVLVLRVAVTLDQVAGLHDLLDGVGIELGRAGIAEHRSPQVAEVEGADEPPDAFLAAVGRPLHARVIDGAAAQRRGAGEIARRFSFGPAFEQQADEDRHALAVRPGELGCRHGMSFGLQKRNGRENVSRRAAAPPPPRRPRLRARGRAAAPPNRSPSPRGRRTMSSAR